MKQLPKISIIIPVYNVEPYIAECLQSVISQTYIGEIECLLVDDCGTDKSIEIAEKLIGDYTTENQKSKIKNQISFHILHHDHNRGLSAARNTGTIVAAGEYVYYLDSDDYIADDCIAELARPLAEYEYDLVVGDMESFGLSRQIPRLSKRTGAVMSKEEIFNSVYGEHSIYPMACNKLVKRSLFGINDLAFMEGQLHEDELWTYKCCSAIQSLYVQNKVTYYYRNNENSIMGTRSDNIQKRVDSHYASAVYVMSHPANINAELQNVVNHYFAGMYLALSIQVYKNNWPQYRNLRQLMHYQPLDYWRNGQLSLSEVKHQFHYVLPPVLGYLYLKLRKLKQSIR